MGLQLTKRGRENEPDLNFDQFYTPNNEQFYSKRPYFTLDASKKEIRLLRVFRPDSYRSSNDPNPHLNSDTGSGDPFIPVRGPESTTPRIACQLLDKISLPKLADDYCTLSYHAGSQHDTELILINGCPFNAFSNLAHALHYVLEAWTAKKTGKQLLIWADQICINQTDLEERGHQVSMMREIYRRCDQTFVSISTPGVENCLSWLRIGQPTQLSTTTDDWALTFEPPLTLAQFKDSFKKMFLVEPKSALQFTRYRNWVQFVDNIENRSSVKPISASQSTDQKEIYSWDSFLSGLGAFVGSAWWRRAWVYQEFIISNEPHLISGTDCFAWTDVDLIIQFVCSGLVAYTHDLINNAKRASQEQYQKYEEILDALDELDFSAISSMIECRRTRRRNTDLIKHLQHSRNCESSDVRDRIYAFIGMTHSGYNITPDYTQENTAVHVMITTAQRIIEFEKTLGILKYVPCVRKELGLSLPTWVPDWSSRETNNGLMAYVGEESKLFAAGKLGPIIPEFQAENSDASNVLLKVTGCNVTSIDESDQLIAEFPNLRSFTTLGTHRVVAPKSARPDDQVWVLQGATSPVLLRPEMSDVYSFLGEVLVYKGEILSGIMFGRPSKEEEEGSRDIWIM